MLWLFSGTYCIGGISATPIACQFGTYNNVTGQSVCSICAPGYACPGRNLQKPQLCPRGFVCAGIKNRI